jgi:hypothetical protein
LRRLVSIACGADSTRSWCGGVDRRTQLTRTAAPPALFFLCLLVLATLTGGACVSVGHDLSAVTELYRDARYEAAQAWFAQLRLEYAAMTPSERATFHYLSGMTAYRLAQHEEALHELALAAHSARMQASALGPAEIATLYRTLEQLSADRASAPVSP